MKKKYIRMIAFPILFYILIADLTYIYRHPDSIKHECEYLRDVVTFR